MPSLQVRDLPKPIYDKLKTLAERERRSMAQQVVVLLEQALATKEEHIMRRKELMNRMMNLDIRLEKSLDLTKIVREDRDRTRNIYSGIR